MERRRVLAALGAGALSGLAGCRGALGGGPGSDELTPVPLDRQRTATPESTGPPGRHGVPANICEEEAKADPGIYAVTDPAFGEEWGDREIHPKYAGGRLSEDRTVIGINGTTPRAYPLAVLSHHEVVNDRLPGTGRPVIVTYCPLCRSGMVADRTVDGAATVFSVTGLLWVAPRLREAVAEDEGRVFGAEGTGGETVSVRHSGNLVMQDAATGSYWSQILARGICGPEAGEYLDAVPSTVTTWGEWLADHPDGQVLLPPPYSGTTEPEGGG